MAGDDSQSTAEAEAGIDYEEDEDDMDNIPAEWVAGNTSFMEMFIDAEDGFNKESRLACRWTTRHLRPRGCRYAFNCYRHQTKCYVRSCAEEPIILGGPNVHAALWIGHGSIGQTDQIGA